MTELGEGMQIGRGQISADQEKQRKVSHEY